MQVGWGFTAVAQQVPRLAGQAGIPCSLNRKDRYSATGLMARNKGQHGFETMLAFCVVKYLWHIAASQLALIKHALRQL